MKRQRVESPISAEIIEDKPTKKLRSEGTSEDKPELYDEIYRMVKNQLRTVSNNPEDIAGITKAAVEETDTPEGKKSAVQLLTEWDSMLNDFEEKIYASDGYHAISVPYHLTLRNGLSAEYDCRILRKLSLVALKYFNQAYEGENFVYHSIVMGNYRHRCGKIYRLTFRARPASSTPNDNDDVKEFEAEVAYASWMRIPIDVSQCTMKTMRKYPLYIEQDELAILAEEAIRYFNEKHQGSHFVLHSLGKGDYTPVVGTRFPITFTAKASNKEEIKNFEAVVERTPHWVLPNGIRVAECSIIEEERSGKTVFAEESTVMVKNADQKRSTESDKAIVEGKSAVVVETIKEYKPPYLGTRIDVGKETYWLISISGKPFYAGLNSRSHEELRWEEQGGTPMGTNAFDPFGGYQNNRTISTTTTDNPIPFTSSTTPHGLTFTFDGNKSNPSSPLFQPNIKSSNLYVAKPLLPNQQPPFLTFENFSTPAEVKEVDPVHKLEEAEEVKRLYHYFEEYQAKLKESDDYLALELPACFNDNISYMPDYCEVTLGKISEEAIQFYNDKHGSEFVFHSLIMACFQPDDEEKMGVYGRHLTRLLRIAFRARPSKSNNNDEDIKEFRAIALYCRMSRNRIHECVVLPERVYALYYNEESLKKCAEGAVERFNREHEGSNLVLRSVVKGSAYSPVPGYDIYVTFKASSDGNENDIKEYEAKSMLTYGWKKTYNGIFYCLRCCLKQDVVGAEQQAA